MTTPNPWEERNFRLSLIAAELVGVTKALIALGKYPAEHVDAAEAILARWNHESGYARESKHEH